MPRYKIFDKAAGQVFKEIVFYKMEHGGNSPSNREIMERTPLNSSAQVTAYLMHLEEEGHISIGQGQSRSIEVKGGVFRYHGHYMAYEIEMERKYADKYKG